MSLRATFTSLAIVMAALTSACAHENTFAEAARASCNEEHVAPGPAMDRCLEETEAALRHAREQRPEPPPPPPGSQQHHPSQQRHG